MQMKQWHFDILFFIGVGGAVVLLFGPALGLNTGSNPLAATGVGAILTFVLTQRNTLTKTDDKKDVKDGDR